MVLCGSGPTMPLELSRTHCVADDDAELQGQLPDPSFHSLSFSYSLLGPGVKEIRPTHGQLFMFP
eukprot:923977-Amphidinium_carterae.1